MVSVRRKGRLGRLTGMAIDFNRHGLGLVLDQPLPKDAIVFLSITGATLQVNNVIGVVHNCTSIDVGYRSGIQFRTTSEFRDDQDAIENQLNMLEEIFGRMGSPSSATG